MKKRRRLRAPFFMLFRIFGFPEAGDKQPQAYRGGEYDADDDEESQEYAKQGLEVSVIRD
jgi:hypothetical protein